VAHGGRRGHGPALKGRGHMDNPFGGDEVKNGKKMGSKLGQPRNAQFIKKKRGLVNRNVPQGGGIRDKKATGKDSIGGEKYTMWTPGFDPKGAHERGQMR